MRASWENTIIAESKDRRRGGQSLSPQSIKREYFKKSETHITCPWKGLASYYDLRVGNNVNKDAA
jgi:uncharacterized protein (DUF427 family)